MRGHLTRLRDHARVQRLYTNGNKGQPFVLVGFTRYFVLSFSLVPRWPSKGSRLCGKPKAPLGMDSALSREMGYTIKRPGLMCYVELRSIRHQTLLLSQKSEFIFVEQTLISDIRLGLITDFRHGQGTFAYPYPTESIDKTLRDCLCRHTFETQTFSELILYLAVLTNSWEHAPSIPFILIDVKDVKEAYAAHNMLSGLHYPLLRYTLGFLSFDELVNVYDVHALQMAVVGNALSNESRIMS
nr:hypothetical protein [Tanacetum cinerariifolium]